MVLASGLNAVAKVVKVAVVLPPTVGGSYWKPNNDDLSVFQDPPFLYSLVKAHTRF